MVVAIGADVPRVFNSTLDVEVGLVGRDPVLAPLRRDPAHDPIDPDVGIAGQLARIHPVIRIAVRIGTRAVRALGGEIPGKILEGIGARDRDDVFDSRGSIRHEVVGIATCRDTVRASPLHRRRVLGSIGIDEVDVAVRVHVEHQDVAVGVRAEVNPHALARPVDSPLVLVDPDVDVGPLRA